MACKNKQYGHNSDETRRQ